jgi:hypothetical protein
MDAIQLIHSADFDGIHLDLTPDGGLHYSGDPVLIAKWLPILRANKSAIVAELHRERRHAKVAAMLGDGRKYAVYVADDLSDPVVATCAIRGIATFELAIPRHSYDGLVLLELIEKHSTESCPTPSQLSGNAIPSPDTREARAAHPARRTA